MKLGKNKDTNISKKSKERNNENISIIDRIKNRESSDIEEDYEYILSEIEFDDVDDEYWYNYYKSILESSIKINRHNL